MPENVCPSGLAWAFNNKLRGLLHNPDSIMRNYVKKGQVVADIGCGPGFFSLALAEMVGEEGRVISVDLQKEMLEKLKSAAEDQKLQSRIILHQCTEDRLSIEEKVDFVLAFWMVHEVPNIKSLFDEIVTILKPEGLFLMVEPKLHTKASTFRNEVEQACAAGLKPCKEVKVSISRGILFSLS